MCRSGVKISFASQTRPEMIDFTKSRVIRVAIVYQRRRHIIDGSHPGKRTSRRSITGKY
jgi:hypothetical protein